MKNTIISIIAIAVFAAVLELFLPWWSIALAAVAIGYLIKQPSLSAFINGFMAIFLLWGLYAFSISHANHEILASKIAQILPFKGHVKALLLATGVVGGLIGGLSALTGSLASKLSAN